MISGILKFTAVGVLFVLIGLSQSSVFTRRNEVVEQPEGELKQWQPEEETEYMEDETKIEYVTFEDIDAMMELEDFENLAAGDGGLRKLAEYDNTCWHGGQSNQYLTLAGREWGSCQSMHRCMCGISPRRMAYYCPALCRPNNCGGQCATPQNCPGGFNMDKGTSRLIMDYDPSMIQRDVYPPSWPENWGPECLWYDNIGEPGYEAPRDTRGTGCNIQNGVPLNGICNSLPCACGLECGEKLSDGNKYCRPEQSQQISVTPSPTPRPSSASSEGGGGGYIFKCIIPPLFGGC